MLFLFDINCCYKSHYVRYSICLFLCNIKAVSIELNAIFHNFLKLLSEIEELLFHVFTDETHKLYAQNSVGVS